MSQEQLMLEAEVGKNQIGLIERGEVNSTISTVNALAKALEVEPFELLKF
ncbi:hypothetical protein CRYO30217_00434 [Parvicella tangerina]|uniref:HTH cro/C1-type domain-containing protein n=2 Tax=Parvicella tangerina TaxID=2829795 RepID=A0A916JJN5_9FLAO|nr:hypothetical protein CRYO30217_00434 [Parvicella tangerina]